MKRISNALVADILRLLPFMVANIPIGVSTRQDNARRMAKKIITKLKNLDNLTTEESTNNYDMKKRKNKSKADSDIDDLIPHTFIGTHNSMTYLKPRHWWGWLLRPFAKCQRLSLVNQWQLGARAFDIRIRFTKDRKAYFAHGLMALQGFVEMELGALNSIATTEKPKKVYVRLVLEDLGKARHNEAYFQEFCKVVAKVFPNLTFYEGRRKSDWALIYRFEDTGLPLHQWVGSMAEDARWYEQLLPKAYALRMNARNRMHLYERGIHLFDFIEE